MTNGLKGKEPQKREFNTQVFISEKHDKIFDTTQIRPKTMNRAQMTADADSDKFIRWGGGGVSTTLTTELWST